jgi:hypothetical protein
MGGKVRVQLAKLGEAPLQMLPNLCGALAQLVLLDHLKDSEARRSSRR